MSMPLDNDSHRSATASYRNSDDLERVRQAAWPSVHAIEEAAEEVRAIVAKYLAPTDSTKALQALNHVYVGAPQDIKDAILSNPDALLILECAAGEANALRTKKVAGPVLPQERTHAAILCLQQATRRLDARLASAVVGLAMPGHEAFYARNEGMLPGDGLFGPAGADLLRDLMERIGGTPEGDDVAARCMAMSALYHGVDKDVDEGQSTQRSLDAAHARTAESDPDAQARWSDGLLPQKVKGATATTKLKLAFAAEMATRASMTTKVGVDTGDA
jgi:hypothetical protein